MPTPTTLLASRRRTGALGRAAFAVALATFGGPAFSAQTVGPDVTVIQLTGIDNNGVSSGIRGYSIGTTSCNVGNQPVAWCNSIGGCGLLQAQDHPVIAQNLFRLKGGRFDQIGMSWLKHGFLSTNSPSASCLPGIGCQPPPLGGDQLGVGCTDTYGASLNGSRPLGMRSEVNAATGDFPYPYTTVGFAGVDQWAQVAEADLDPVLNPGALYFAEGHYVTADDARFGNGLNNASWAPVTVAPGTYNLFLGATIREESAIRAWPLADPTVQLLPVDVQTPGFPAERFHVARKVSEVAPGSWHYEYAVHNLNSARAAVRLAVTFSGAAAVTGIGFKDIEHHSGEPYVGTDWVAAFDGASGTVSWETDDFAADPNANALRWSTLFNFWFDADTGPEAISRHVLTLFVPGTPCRVSFSYAPDYVFADDFETGDLCSWSAQL
ncbi:MAG: hypothetical protein F9K18_14980 [Thermoanaerobaculia bacterium]|nr:MAG: hypothetical protein F9K18_14980 [Thermoanaerobaculia bacterium]